ncbi:VOC family protein [Candidatus Kaiserbacteria bacterium]|nr:VOC family protein [Candidatus Kaiserbacteria bacterium]
MGDIVPHLWFDTEAKEATEFYTLLFPNSKSIRGKGRQLTASRHRPY